MSDSTLWPKVAERAAADPNTMSMAATKFFICLLLEEASFFKFSASDWASAMHVRSLQLNNVRTLHACRLETKQRATESSPAI